MSDYTFDWLRILGAGNIGYYVFYKNSSRGLLFIGVSNMRIFILASKRTDNLKMRIKKSPIEQVF